MQAGVAEPGAARPPRRSSRTCRPISTKMAFSRTNCTVRQLVRSAIRDDALCQTRRVLAEDQTGRDHGEHAGAVDALGREVGDERREERDRGVRDRIGDAAADGTERVRDDDTDHDPADHADHEVATDVPDA